MRKDATSRARGQDGLSCPSHVHLLGEFKSRSCNPSSAGSKIWCPIVEISDLRSDICVGPNGWMENCHSTIAQPYSPHGRLTIDPWPKLYLTFSGRARLQRSQSACKISHPELGIAILKRCFFALNYQGDPTRMHTIIEPLLLPDL